MDRQSVGIIGAGQLGGTVGRLLGKAGHPVFFASRHPERLRRLCRDLPDAGTGPVAEAVKRDVVVLATPFDALKTIATPYAGQLSGKILIDATNPLKGSESRRQATRIGVALFVMRLFPEARLVRCFSAVEAASLEADDQRPLLAMPMASDDLEALDIVADLVRSIQCVPVPTGNLVSARLFQPGQPAYLANATADRLRGMMHLPAAG